MLGLGAAFALSLATPLAAAAQPSGKVYRIGWPSFAATSVPGPR